MNLFYGRASLVVVLLLLFRGSVCAQTITIKANANPLFFVAEGFPLSAGLGLEVGLKSSSAFQLFGSYRHFRRQDQEPDTGPKFYVDYRYYCKAEQPQTGLFVGPFVGIGQLKLGVGDEPPIGAKRRKRTEQEVGLLLGYQKLFSRLTVEAFAGPAYQRVTTTDARNFTDQVAHVAWLRAGFTVGTRLKK